MAKKKLLIPPFILINETIEKFGYNPNELYGTNSHKLLMVCKCNDCGNIYDSQYASCLCRYKKNKKCKFCSNKENSINSSEYRSELLLSRVADGTYIPPMLGKNHTEETKQILRENRVGKTYIDYYGLEKAIEMKINLTIKNSGENNPFYGKIHTEETREILREHSTRNTRRGKESNFYGKNYNKKLTSDEFFNKASYKHNNLYDYSLSEYVEYNDYIEIICKKHGIFKQKASIHLSGCGCQKCNNSVGEIMVSNFLSENNIIFQEQYKFDECRNKKPLPFDFYLSDLNICIEYDGEFHYKDMGFNNLEAQLSNDNIKNIFCEKNNIKLIRIPYTQRDNINKILEECIIE